MKIFKFAVSLIIGLILTGCTAVNVKLFTTGADPLKEFALQGDGNEKILVIPVKGVISDFAEFDLIHSKPSMVQEIVSQLRKAENDPAVKVVLLKINSPGGTTTATDILYHELMDFKQRTGAKIVVSMMDVAASGGYYISLPADCIMAHPTSLTGSVGVIFMRPEIAGLMEKIGVGIEVNKSGINKDMGSPFRRPSEAENKLFQELIDDLAKRFVSLVVKHRKISGENLKKVCEAGVFLPEEAKKLGMIDEIGYLDDAIQKSIKLAKMTDPIVVVYRRNLYHNDNIYNTSNYEYQGKSPSLINLGPFDSAVSLPGGFYYIWAPGAK
jgi:protease-4